MQKESNWTGVPGFSMKAITLNEFGPPENLRLGEHPVPDIGPQDVLVKVRATALNRADTLQRKGVYPPPPGASPILGLEMAGRIEKIGEDVNEWNVGDRVYCLLSGGGYAEYVSVHSGLLMRIPDNLDFEEAAAIPEAFLTAYQALFYLGNLEKNEKVLIHAGASGVGTSAIQLAKSHEASQILITASAGKHDLCKRLGAHHTIDYKSQDFEEVIADVTNGMGVDVIVDFLGASYFQQNINSLSQDGRLVILGLMGGNLVEKVNLGKILSKRLKIMGSTLRSRSHGYKVQLTRDFEGFANEKLKSGELKPIIDSVLDWNDVVDAHKRMESNKNKGKIVLKVQ